MNKKMYTASSVVNFFLDLAEQEDIPITMMKLLKLVYIAYGWFYALTGEPLFDDKIEAWRHGPVIASVYHEFKCFQDRPIINQRSIEIDFETMRITTHRINAKDDLTISILSKVWNIYKYFSAYALRDQTHEVGTPWQISYKSENRNTEISPEAIKSHFQSKIAGYVNG